MVMDCCCKQAFTPTTQGLLVKWRFFDSYDELPDVSVKATQYHRPIKWEEARFLWEYGDRHP